MKKLFTFLMLLCSTLVALEPTRFKELLKEPPPEWMVEQIAKELAPYERELSSASLDELFEAEKETLLLVRVRVSGGKLSIERSQNTLDHSVPPLIMQGLCILHALTPLPDLDFIFSALDTISQFKGYPLPIFTESKHKESTGLILFPDRFALKCFAPERALIQEGNNFYSWEHKVKMLLFRGSDTGAQYSWESPWGIQYFKGIIEGKPSGEPVDPNEWRAFPRPKLVAMSVLYPDLIDAKFVTSLHYKPMIEKAKEEGFFGSIVTMKNHPRYRYLMDIDGNCASCPRTALLFHSNSVVFKQMTGSMQWFYGLLKPYVHFIPVAEDLSDLVEKIEWAREHDAECKEISANARALCAEALTDERIYQYLYLLLSEYAKKQSGVYE